MRKQPRSYIEARAAHADTLDVVLHYVLFRKPDATVSLCEADWEQDGEQSTYYHFTLYGATRANGGYLTVAFDRRDQNPQVSVYQLDQYELSPASPTILQIGRERILAARARIWHAKRASERIAV